MKISEVQHYINKIGFLNESMSLSDLRKKLIKKEFKIEEKDGYWYSHNSDKLISLINSIVGPTAEKHYNKELKSFNTEPYLNKGILTPKSLFDVLSRKINIIDIEKEYPKEKSSIDEQYEMMKIDNGVEIYAVYTPQANHYLAHSLLKSSVTPTWCIAASDAANAWRQYHIWTARRPCVFIILKRGETKLDKYDKNGKQIKVTNIMYQILGEPDESQAFANNDIDLEDFCKEVRDAEQYESSLEDTTLFKYIKIGGIEGLESKLRQLMNTPKARTFSQKYGYEMYIDIRRGFHEDAKTKKASLIKAARVGCFGDFRKEMDYNDASLFLVEMIRSKTLDDDSLIQFHGLVDDELFEKGVDYFIKRKGVRYHLIKLIAEKCSDSLFEKALDGISKEDIDGHLLRLIFRMGKEKYFDDVMRLIEKKGVYDLMMVTTLLANGKMDTFEKHYEDFIKSDRILGLIVPAVLEKTDDINLQKRVIEDTIKNNNFTSLTLSNLLTYNKSKEIIKFALDKLIEKRYIISMYSLKKIYQNHKDYFDIFLNAFIENGTDRPDIEFLCSTDTSDENILRLLRKLYPEGYLARMRNIEFSKDLEYVLDYRPKLFGKASRVIIDSGIKNAEQFERLAYRTGKIYEIFSVIIENRLKITPDIFSIFGFTLTDKKLIEMILNYIIEYGYFSYRLYDDFLYYQNKHKKLISKLTHAIVSWRLVDERYLNIAIKRQNDEAKKLFKENMNETPKNKDFEELEMFMKQFD